MRTPRRLGRAALAFAVFLIFGPAIGSLLFGILATAVVAITDPGLGLAPLVISVAFVGIAYAIGGAQAAFVGAVTAFEVWRKSSAPLWLPLLAAASAAAYTLIRSDSDGPTALLLGTVHIAAAGLCWLIARKMLGWSSPSEG